MVQRHSAPGYVSDNPGAQAHRAGSVPQAPGGRAQSTGPPVNDTGDRAYRSRPSALSLSASQASGPSYAMFPAFPAFPAFVAFPAGLDWIWELPAVALPALLLAAGLLRRAEAPA